MRNKRAYSKPILESETFVPQNYIAACGDTEYGNYLFECNAGLENTSYNVFLMMEHLMHHQMGTTNGTHHSQDTIHVTRNMKLLPTANF